MGGVEATKKILVSMPEVKILMLTISEDEQDLFMAIRSGAQGYLLKSSSTQELLTAIRQVYNGDSPITPMMNVKLVEEYTSLLNATNYKAKKREEFEALTNREKDVLHLVARGMSNKEIDNELSISLLTVKAHLSSILDKLHMRGRVEAAAWAIHHSMLREGYE